MKQPEAVFHKNNMIVAGAFLIAPLIYVFVIWLTQNSPDFQPAKDFPMEQARTWAALATVLVVAFGFHCYRRKVPVESIQDAFKTNLVVALGAFQCPSIFGMTMGFLGADLMTTAAFAGVTLVCSVQIFPFPERAKARLQEIEKAQR